MTRTTTPPRGEDITDVLVTGASSDIGHEVCKRLARREDVQVLGTYHKNRPDDLGTILPSQGIDLSTQPGLDELDTLVEASVRGPLALVHCVGRFWEHESIEDCSLEAATQMVTSHFLTLYGVLNRVLPRMAKLGGGRIVALSCTSTNFHYPDMAAFTAAKAAVEALIKCAANEWAVAGITANSVAMSTVGTAKVLASPSKPLSKEENYLAPQEAAELVEELLFLAPRYFSGNVVRPLKHSDTYYNTGYFQRNPRAT